MAAIFRRPQVFEKSGSCFSKTLASCIQFLIECSLVLNDGGELPPDTLLSFFPGGSSNSLHCLMA
jgi:hypothetical protein